MTTIEMPRLDLRSFELHAVQPVLPVQDIEKAVEWYRDTLGFTVDFVWGDPPEHARVLAVDHATRAGIQLTQSSVDTSEMQRAGWIMIHVGAGVEKLYDEYLARGVRIGRELGHRPWGMIDFDIVDPDGNTIRFAGESGEE
jgi:catechol 2,3-dioxygenase-like lactoylglutathione lyase family enzyme